MNKLLLFCILILVVPFSTGFSAGKDAAWRRIVPLVSTREEVEKLLGKPEKEIDENLDENDRAFIAEYQLADGELRVAYGVGGCSSIHEQNYFAPKWTVLQVIYYPEESVEFEKLELDLKKLKTKVYGA